MAIARPQFQVAHHRDVFHKRLVGNFPARRYAGKHAKAVVRTKFRGITIAPHVDRQQVTIREIVVYAAKLRQDSAINVALSPIARSGVDVVEQAAILRVGYQGIRVVVAQADAVFAPGFIACQGTKIMLPNGLFIVECKRGHVILVATQTRIGRVDSTLRRAHVEGRRIPVRLVRVQARSQQNTGRQSVNYLIVKRP